LEDLVAVIDSKFWSGKKVLLTGHTGFKGSWLAFWLNHLGAEVTGYALDPTDSQTLFSQLGLGSSVYDCRGDINDLHNLTTVVKNASPQIVIHMAAQALVLESYKNPVATFSTNVMGTVNLLESVRSLNSVRLILVITSDKCYENLRNSGPHKETDPFGGHDPYSSSKGCAELVTRSFRDSFFKSQTNPIVGIASARAGNVIGGGDWATNRLVPDAMRAFFRGETFIVRSPTATRPWQHVFEPLSGYLLLCERLWEDPIEYSSGWNFGPRTNDIANVAAVCDLLVEYYGDNASWRPEGDIPLPIHESEHLQLDVSKAKEQLGWVPKWNLSQTIENTVRWYKLINSGEDVRVSATRQIDDYSKQSIF